MEGRKTFVAGYEQLIKDNVEAEKYRDQLKITIAELKKQLTGLDKAKEEFNKFQIDHQKALDELEQKKNDGLAEIKRQQDNTSRVLKKQIEDANQKSTEVDNREKAVSAKEKTQRQQEIDLRIREEKVAERETVAEAKIAQVKIISDHNKKRGEELSVAEGRLKQDQNKVTQDRSDNQTGADNNAEVRRQNQQEDSNLREKQNNLSQREATTIQTEEDNKKRTEELNNRESGLNSSEAKLEAKDKEQNERKKNLDDKERNLEGEKDDLAFATAQLNRAIEDAKKKGIKVR